MTEVEKIRIDKYLWCIRIFKTRALATEACEKGKVRLLGQPVKAARKVVINDEYEVRTEAKKWLIKVIEILDHRVKYSEAVKYYLDLTPAEEKERLSFQAASFHTGKRLSKLGRPSKKQKRDLDEFFGNQEE
jgi:ribosome-associated heat shock protein Hsp15